MTNSRIKLKIAVIFIAEPYQCYHGAAVAIELSRTPYVDVTVFYNDPVTIYHLERIRHAYSAPQMNYVRLNRTLLTRLAQSIKVLGYLKHRLVKENSPSLMPFDAVFSVEDTVYNLFDGLKPSDRPRKIYMPHGVGDGGVGFSERTRHFDFVLPPGAKSAERMLSLGHIKPGNYATPGLVKIETADRLRSHGVTHFRNERPIVFYNSHKTRGLASWSRFIEPLLDVFSDTKEYNLIVAPHVKLFRRKSAWNRARWHRRSTDNVLIDTGSDASMDMTYTREADIYVGDISSQVYEFLLEPRPCVFINAYKRDWRDDPNFSHWHLGDVITDPAELMPAISAAYSRHHIYVEKQRQLAAHSLGDRSPGAARRASEEICRFLRR